MDDQGPSIGELMASALAMALLRKGVLDEDDINEAADRLDREDRGTAAHVLRCSIVKAEETPQSEWEAGKARARFRVIDGGEE